MKIVQIGDSDGGGGAANAMLRLHEALLEIGVESQLLVRERRSLKGSAATIVTRGDTDDFFPVVRDAMVRQYVSDNRTDVSNTHFSLHIDGADLSQDPLVAASDIVHLHWTAPFQMPTDVRALTAIKPLVWTLHDLEPLSGGCHFPAACEGYVRECAACPQLAWDPFGVPAATLHDKIALWSATRPTFVAPSQYIAECARRSAVAIAAGASIVHIPLGIDSEVFRPQSRVGARRALHLPSDAFIVLCGSNYNAERRKGLRLLENVVALAKARAGNPAHVLVLTVGEPTLALDGLDGVRIVALGRVASDDMPTVFAAADVFVHLALEDNFPGMVLEALSCGTPTLAFDVGGVSEIVEDGFCGRLVPAGDELAMAAALSALLLDAERARQMGDRAREHVEAHFTAALAARRHRALYDDLLEFGARSLPLETISKRLALDTIFGPWSNACLVREADRVRARVREVEGTNAELARDLAAERRRGSKKNAEIVAVHGVANERERAIESLHAAAAEGAARLRAEIAERDLTLARLEARVTALHAEIALVQSETSAKSRRIEELDASVLGLENENAELERKLAAERRYVVDKDAEVRAIHAVARERERAIESLHAAAAEGAAHLHAEVADREVALTRLEARSTELHAEIALVHRVAAERGSLIEELHEAAERNRRANL